METKSKQEIRLKAVQTDNETDFYLEVKSNAKAAKETGMKEQFESGSKSSCKKYIRPYTVRAALKGQIKYMKKKQNR